MELPPSRPTPPPGSHLANAQLQTCFIPDYSSKGDSDGDTNVKGDSVVREDLYGETGEKGDTDVRGDSVVRGYSDGYIDVRGHSDIRGSLMGTLM